MRVEWVIEGLGDCVNARMRECKNACPNELVQAGENVLIKE